MDRRASLELSLETAVKLLLGAVIILFIIYMAYTLISLFVSGNRDYTAKRNLDLLETRIETAQEEGLARTSVILSLPLPSSTVGYELRSFSAKAPQDTIDLRTMNMYDLEQANRKYTIRAPEECDLEGSCVCVFKRQYPVTVNDKRLGDYKGYGVVYEKGQSWEGEHFKPISCKNFKMAVEGTVPSRVEDLERGGPMDVRISFSQDGVTFSYP